MTDQEYAEFMSYLFERYVRPRLPRVRRHLDHHMKDDVQYHLGQAERSARILRFIENPMTTETFMASLRWRVSPA